MVIELVVATELRSFGVVVIADESIFTDWDFDFPSVATAEVVSAHGEVRVVDRIEEDAHPFGVGIGCFSPVKPDIDSRFDGVFGVEVFVAAGRKGEDSNQEEDCMLEGCE